MSHLMAAARFAHAAHTGQTRKYNGTPYIWHPMRVAGRLMLETEDPRQLAAAWLHDVVEDCGVSLATIEAGFGVMTAQLVGELTNPSKQHPGLTREAKKAMDRDHIASISIAAKRIKILDRLDNLREMAAGPTDVFQRYIRETRLLAEVLCGAWPILDAELMKFLDDAIVGEGAAATGGGVSDEVARDRWAVLFPHDHTEHPGWQIVSFGTAARHALAGDKVFLGTRTEIARLAAAEGAVEHHAPGNAQKPAPGTG